MPDNKLPPAQLWKQTGGSLVSVITNQPLFRLAEGGKIVALQQSRVAARCQFGQFAPVIFDCDVAVIREIAELIQLLLQAVIEMLIRISEITLKDDHILIIGKGKVMQNRCKTMR